MKKPIMLFTSKDALGLSKKDLDNSAIRTSLIKTLRWYELLEQNAVLTPAVPDTKRCDCGVGQADYFCGACGGSLKDNNGN